jgi:membrane protease YdiL (CAAX protease family)
MQAIASKPLAAGSATAATVAHKSSCKYLVWFFVAAYALAGLCFGVPILAARGLITPPAPEAAFLTLATLGVCLAGLGAAASESGRTEVRALLAQVLRWRVRPVWYLAAIFVPALFPAGGFVLGLALGQAAPAAPPLQVWLSLPLVLVALVVPAILEEIGWRGYALPRLQRRLGALTASLVLGVIWAGMHLPLWLLPDFGFADQSIPLYVAQLVAISVVLAWLYNVTGGSLLLTGIAHAAMNGWPMPWGAALQALPEDARAIPVSDFHLLITAATVVFALLLEIATRGWSKNAWQQP